MAFIAAGVPGVLLALCIVWLLHEPRREAAATVSGQVQQPSLTVSIAEIARSRPWRGLTLAVALSGFYVYGLPSWTGVYLIRVLHMTAAAAGLVLGLTMGVGGAVGTLLGGALGDRLGRERPERSLLVCVGSFLISIPFAVAAFQADRWQQFTCFYLIAVICTAAYFGPAFSQVQRSVEPCHRATATSIFVIVGNLIGAGLCPMLVGLTSDLLRPRWGNEGLRIVILACEPLAFIPAILYFRVMRVIGAQADAAAASATDRFAPVSREAP